MNADGPSTLACLAALDLLEGEEKVRFDSEQRREPALRRSVEQLRETAALLAFTAPAALPSPFLRERILASAAARPPRRARRATSLPWAVAAGFALIAGVLGWQSLELRTDLAAQQGAVLTRQAEAEARARAAFAEIEGLRDRLELERSQAHGIITELRRQADVAELKVASLASLLGQSPDAQAIAVWNPLTQEGVLTVVNLPALESGKDYQLWLVDPQYDIPVDGGVFRVDPATGEARVSFRPDRPVASVNAFAVSLERSGGVPKAEGPMVLITR